jgi:hypothetical protein
MEEGHIVSNTVVEEGKRDGEFNRWRSHTGVWLWSSSSIVPLIVGWVISLIFVGGGGVIDDKDEDRTTERGAKARMLLTTLLGGIARRVIYWREERPGRARSI